MSPASPKPTKAPDWSSRLINLLSPSARVDETNPGKFLRVAHINHRVLYRCLEELDGVAFTHRPWFLWEGRCARFIFGATTFHIEPDPWDGALWICSNESMTQPGELAAIKAHLEAFTSVDAPERAFKSSLMTG
jgi:hypothetical protein